MPTYQYRCKDCSNELEVVQKFTDDALTECPACTDGELRKVFNAVGVVFKGSGFYRNDSRSANGSTGASSTKAPAASSTGSKDTGSSSGSSGSGSSGSGPSGSGSSGSSGSGSPASTPAPAA